jgi:hypothetical protein
MILILSSPSLLEIDYETIRIEHAITMPHWMGLEEELEVNGAGGGI